MRYYVLLSSPILVLFFYPPSGRGPLLPSAENLHTRDRLTFSSPEVSPLAVTPDGLRPFFFFLVAKILRGRHYPVPRFFQKEPFFLFQIGAAKDEVTQDPLFSRHLFFDLLPIVPSSASFLVDWKY